MLVIPATCEEEDYDHDDERACIGADLYNDQEVDNIFHLIELITHVDRVLHMLDTSKQEQIKVEKSRTHDQRVLNFFSDGLKKVLNQIAQHE